LNFPGIFLKQANHFQKLPFINMNSTMGAPYSLQSIDDHQLMNQVKAGETDKLGLLFEKYHRPLYNLFLWQTRNPSLSEDLVQEVFLRILKYRRSYRGEGQFRTWMFRIAHSTRLDHYRRKKHPTTSMDEGVMIPDESPAPDQIIEDQDRSRMLMQALSQLSEVKREMLILSRFEYMKYEDIAKAMGCRIGTVKSTIHCAVKELAVHYKKLTAEEIG
jgi:RNA polymerase sigma factor (sigma-70 family)